MLSFAKLLATFALICATTRAIDIHTYSKEYIVNHADYHIMPHKIASADHSFLHVTCEKTDMPHLVHCHVAIEMPSGTPKHCNDIKLDEPETREIVLTDPMMVKRMGNKVLFQWFSMNKTNGYHYQYKKVSVIDMDKCTDIHLDFPLDKLDWPNHQVIVYHDCFYVYVTSKMLCDGYEQCIIRYNYNGEKVGKPMHFPSKYHNIYSMPVNYYNPEKGAYFVGVEWNSRNGVMHVTHVNHTDVQTDLFSFPIKEASLMKYVRSSNEHEFCTVCYLTNPEDTKVHCLQYDVMGHKMMDTIIEMERNHRMINVFNLHHGGVVLAYRGCNGAPNCTILRVKMVHPGGHVLKHVEVPGIEYQCTSPSKDLVIDHMEIENEHCFYIACAHEQSAGKVSFKYLGKCLDKITYF